MKSEDRFFKSHDTMRTWNRYCGFLDLSTESFVDIQKRLLMEQIDLVADSSLGRIIMRDRKPASVEEFRNTVALTRYADYAPYIGEFQEDCLAEKPQYWVHTSFTEGDYKRFPWSHQFHKVQIRNIIASLILSSASRKGDIRLSPGSRILAILPEKPFVSAQLAFGLVEEFSAAAILPLELCEKLPFRQKIDTALRRALTTDIDYIITMTSSFLPLEQGFQRITKNKRLISTLLKSNLMVALHLLKNRPRRIFRKEGELLPKDLWSVKGIVAWGTDSEAFEHRTYQNWNKPMFQFYGSSEAGLIAMQDWRKDTMAFLPDSVFLEFIPREETEREENPSTVLVDELEDGKVYELVITGFYGMPLLRYRQGDLIEVVRQHDAETGDLPRLMVHNRADDVIDLFGIARLNTKAISEAIELTEIPLPEWTIRKEYEQSKPVLRLYAEIEDARLVPDLERRLNKKLKVVDRHYGEATFVMAYNPIRVTALQNGAFERYYQQYRNNGHEPELSNLPKVNLPDSVVNDLVRMSN